MVESATILMKEAGLPPLPLKQASSSFPPYRATGSTPATPSRSGRVNSQGAVTLPTTPVAVPSTSTPTQQAGMIKVNLASRYSSIYYGNVSMTFIFLTFF